MTVYSDQLLSFQKMSKNQSSVPEFDENFFANIAVPLTKDYSRLSSSPSRDQPCDSSYFEKYYRKKNAIFLQSEYDF